ncbi:MAG: fructosamine kinase family protein [Phycisphaerales bacterium]|nr:fructosamine kinase family protein [Phycisphaerales bacterium]
MTPGSLHDRLAETLGSRVANATVLQGGCVADTRLIDLGDGRRVVVKVDHAQKPGLAVEGMMLEYLGETGRVPVPTVLHSEPDLLVMDHVAHDGKRAAEGEIEAADMLARLHAVSADRYGFACDTRVGSLVQPNDWMDEWPRFFAERRLLHMGRRAHKAGSLPPGTLDRLERLAADIDRLIDPQPLRPSLIHGDVWPGNVLWHAGRVAAFIDPAISFSDPEIELAFIDLFGCFGTAFWDRYAEISTIRPGFFEKRKDLYNLYPLLVHATLFDGGYGASVERSIGTLGY